MLNFNTYFELDDNLMKTIKAYLCYTCFSWLKPLYFSLNKKVNLSIEKNCAGDNDEEKTINKNSNEMIILIRRFQQLFDNYIHDILNIETLNYFKAKNEIERINKLLTTSSSAHHVGEGMFYKFIIIILSTLILLIYNLDGMNEANGYNSTIDDIDEINSTNELTSEINVNSLTENIENYNISDELCELNEQEEFSSDGCKSLQNNNTNKNCDIVCINGSPTKIFDYKINSLEQNPCFSKESDLGEFENEKYKEIYQFYQNLKFELEKFYNLSNKKQPIKHVAHLEIEASKKKKLENIVADYLSKRIDSPNPYLFIAELNMFIRDLEICDFATKECN